MKKSNVIGDIAKWRSKMSMEETERAESSVAESHNLIAIATLLIKEAR